MTSDAIAIGRIEAMRREILEADIPYLATRVRNGNAEACDVVDILVKVIAMDSIRSVVE